MKIIESNNANLSLNDEELELFKKSIDHYHAWLCNEMTHSESKRYTELEADACILEGMCQEMDIPGYDFS